jgi:hypothetical protein
MLQIKFDGGFESSSADALNGVVEALPQAAVGVNPSGDPAQ